MQKKSNQKSLDAMKKLGKLVTNVKWYDVLLENRFYKAKNGQTIISPKLCLTTSQNHLFTFHERNRKITGGHPQMIGRSITELGYINRQVVVVKLGNTYYIADGQNMFTWLLSQEMPVEFLLCEAQDESEVINLMRQMNSSSKRWGLKQFVNVCKTNNPKNPYDKLSKLYQEYYSKTKITDKVLGAMMYDEDYFNEGKSSNAIKNGYFNQNVPDVRLLKRLNALKRFYKKTKMSATNYLNAALVIQMYDKQDLYFSNEKKFLANIVKIIHKENKTNIKYGNKEDARDLVRSAWELI
jgi:hypothetical protein